MASIYLSRSFDERDEEQVTKKVQAILQDERLVREFELELFDSSPTRGGALTDQIKADIARSDVVLCIFTRRHKIEGEPSYSVPPYVVSEAAYADSLGKRLILLLEKGVEKKEMGLVEARGDEFLRFDRSTIDSATFHKKLKDLARYQLDEHKIEANPPYEFVRYRFHYTVYRNGYIMSHLKAKVRVLRKEPVTHSMGVTPSASASLRVPSAKNLLGVLDKDAVPYPRRAFAGFASADDRLEFAPVETTIRKGERIRRFEVTFPETGDFEYQWIWGCPNGFDPSRDIESTRTLLSDRRVYRVDMLLRLHRLIPDRRRPRMAPLGPDTQLVQPGAKTITDETLEPHYERGVPVGEEYEEHTPLFKCYQFAAPVQPATDLLLMF